MKHRESIFVPYHVPKWKDKGREQRIKFYLMKRTEKSGGIKGPMSCKKYFLNNDMHPTSDLKERSDVMQN